MRPQKNFREKRYGVWPTCQNGGRPGLADNGTSVSKNQITGLLGQGCRRSRLGRAEGKENQCCMIRHSSNRSKFSPVNLACSGTRAIWLLATTTGHLMFLLGNRVHTTLIHHHACIDRWRACLAWWFPQEKPFVRSSVSRGKR